MKAVVVDDGRCSLRDRARPKLATRGEVLVRVQVAGICRTDVLVAEGRIARICDLECSCSIPGLSGLAERFIQGQNRDMYDQRAAIERLAEVTEAIPR